MRREHTYGQDAPSRENTAALVRALGIISVGFGVVGLIAPRALARLAGLPLAPSLVRACAVGDLAVGIGLLSQPRAVPWIQIRLAGDAVGLVGLAAAAPFSAAPGRVALATGAAAGLAALDLQVARQLERDAIVRPMHVKTTIAVNKPAQELYRFWRELTNLPRVMPHLKSVQAIDETRSHWVAAGPAGASVEWDAEIIDDRPGERLAWRSADGSDVYNAGSVRFDAGPAGHGTFVTVELLYEPPAGSLGSAVARLFGKEPGQAVRADLRAFKQVMETGEIATTEGQPAGATAPSTYDFLSRVAS
jgi:uncharacterized membrane protein